MAERLRGNQFWRLRTTHGRGRIFSDPALLWEEAQKYFDWSDRTPWLKSELVKHQGVAEEYEVPLGRPYSILALTTYLGVSENYFRTARSELRAKVEKETATENERRLLDTIQRVEQVVKCQQIEGAAVGVFNANLVARLNGIADYTNVTGSGETLLRVTVRDQDSAQHLKELEDLL